MKNWTLRELLLLIAILAFVSAYVAASWRNRRLPEDVFDIPSDQWEAWAKEIDPGGRKSSYSHGSGRGFWPNTQGSHWTFETSSGKVDAIVNALRRRLEEHMTTGGWQWTAEDSQVGRKVYSLRKRSSRYVLRGNYVVEPIPINQWNVDPDRVYLTLRWMALGYAPSDRDMRLADPATVDE